MRAITWEWGQNFKYLHDSKEKMDRLMALPYELRYNVYSRCGSNNEFYFIFLVCVSALNQKCEKCKILGRGVIFVCRTVFMPTSVLQDDLLNHLVQCRGPTSTVCLERCKDQCLEGILFNHSWQTECPTVSVFIVKGEYFVQYSEPLMHILVHIRIINYRIEETERYVADPGEHQGWGL